MTHTVQGEVLPFALDSLASCGAAPGAIDGMSAVLGLEFHRGADHAMIVALTPSGGVFVWAARGPVRDVARFTRGLLRRATVTGIALAPAAVPWMTLAAQGSHWSRGELSLIGPADHDASDLLRRITGRLIRHGGDAALLAAAQCAGLIYDNGTAVLMRRRQRGNIGALRALAMACNLQRERAVPQLFFLGPRRGDD